MKGMHTVEAVKPVSPDSMQGREYRLYYMKRLYLHTHQAASVYQKASFYNKMLSTYSSSGINLNVIQLVRFILRECVSDFRQTVQFCS